MIILKERVVGYNNVLTLATSGTKFGVNKDINYVDPVKTTGSDGTAQGGGETPPKTDETTTVLVFPKPDETVHLLGSAVTLGFLVARYVV